MQSYNPTVAGTTMVWAVPRSLATTEGIAVAFSSSAYLDVSVRQVSLPRSGISTIRWMGCPIRGSPDL